MTPTFIDWILAAAFTIALPAWGVATWPAYVASAKGNRPGVRVRAYLEMIVVQWSLSLLVLAWWAVCARPWPTLGLGDPFVTNAPWIVVVAIAGLAAYHVHAIAKVPLEELAKAQAGLGEVIHVMPRGPLERRLFHIVSVTAGVTEELIYRGFVPCLLATFVAPWIAIVVATVLFGLGHTYQGPAGIVKTGVVGGLMAGLTLWSGTLWPAMVLHAIVDVHGGTIGGRVANATPRDV